MRSKRRLIPAVSRKTAEQDNVIETAPGGDGQADGLEQLLSFIAAIISCFMFFISVLNKMFRICCLTVASVIFILSAKKVSVIPVRTCALCRKDKRLSAKEVMGNHNKLIEWQYKFHEHKAQEFTGSEQGESSAVIKRKHIPAWRLSFCLF